MTLKLIQGFETCRDDSDFRAMGWVPTTVKQQAFFPNSFSGTPGTALRTPVYKSDTTATVGTTACNDIGYFNTGVTVNQAYTAGGFSLGGAMEFNQSANGQFQPVSSSASQLQTPQLAFDGTNYWSVDNSNNVWTSPDLKTWTKTASQPPYTTSVYATPFYMGGGVVAIGGMTTASATVMPLFWTSNGGATWNTYTLPTWSSAALRTNAIATGNSTYPHCVIQYCNAASSGGIFIGTLGGTMTQVLTFSGSAGIGSQIHLINGYLVFAGNTALYSALASSSTLNTSAAWSTATTPNTINFDIGFVNNVWVVTSQSNTVYYYSGGSTNPPTGTISWTSSAVGATNFTPMGMVTYNNVLYLTGYNSTTAASNALVFSSTNGTSWTAVHHLTADSTSGVTVSGTGNSALTWPVYDGTKYVMTGGLTYRGFFSSTDMVNNWKTESIFDSAESAVVATVGNLGLWAGTALSAVGVITGVSASYCAQATVSAVTSGNRTIGFYAGAAAATGTATIANTSPYHYYEIVGRPVAGTTNLFNLTLYVDQTAVATKQAAMAATTDTTSLLIIALSTRGQISGWDDIYFTVDDGTGVTGPIGICNVAAIRPTAVVGTAQWTGVNTGVNNAQNVRQGGLSSNTTNGVTAYTSGAQDKYSTTDTLPANFKPLAVQFEGYASKVGIPNSTSTLGIISGSTEFDAPALTATSTTPTYMSQVSQTDPNGNIAWTVTSVQNLQFTVKKS